MAAVRALACGAATCAVFNHRRQESYPGWFSIRRPQLCRRQLAHCEQGKSHTSASASPALLSSNKSLHLPRAALIRKNSENIANEYLFPAGDLLGEGAYAEVIVGVNKRTGLERAIKFIDKKNVNAEEFEIEIRALMELDHMHIVKVLQYFESATDFMIVQELCRGPDLVQYVVKKAVAAKSQTAVDEKEISIILRQMLKAICACHKHNIIHRDIKLENFMLTGETMSVRMIDFGLALLGTRGGETGVVFGTCSYMAPEAFFKDSYTSAIDLWSLGVGLYIMLTLEQIFPESEDPDEEVADVTNCLRDPKFVSSHIKACSILKQRKLSKDARDLLNKLLTYDPAKRITAEQALQHPFIRKHADSRLENPEFTFDKNMLAKLEKFANAPRLKRIALMTLAHFTSQQPPLLQVRMNFRSIDKSGDGELSIQELTKALQSNGIAVPQNLEAIFAVCDSSGNGRLNFNEFIACMFPDSMITEQLCAAAFNMLDRECTGVLGQEQLRFLFADGSAEGKNSGDIVLEATGKTSITVAEFQEFMLGSK